MGSLLRVGVAPQRPRPAASRARGLAAAGALLVDTIRWSLDRPAQNLERVAGSELGAENLRLSDFSEVAGTDLLYATLGQQDEYMSSSFDKGYRTSRNVLFFDTRARTAH